MNDVLLYQCNSHHMLKCILRQLTWTNLTSKWKLINKAMNLNEILDKLLNETLALKKSMNNNQVKRCQSHHQGIC